ncbi:hypothetical protein K7X08_011731 [Anisodus acutangulus]|uniref:Uncharacterized protein n=1 Tax=Anisodus acutangulus TaxID=402998 RepID=A0A9Q1MK42_9SOLA|nr:hypothetical protein K7X08_011731 [Anisodus acutangulus]
MAKGQPRKDAQVVNKKNAPKRTVQKRPINTNPNPSGTVATQLTVVTPPPIGGGVIQVGTIQKPLDQTNGEVTNNVDGISEGSEEAMEEESPPEVALKQKEAGPKAVPKRTKQAWNHKQGQNDKQTYVEKPGIVNPPIATPVHGEEEQGWINAKGKTPIQNLKGPTGEVQVTNGFNPLLENTL